MTNRLLLREVNQRNPLVPFLWGCLISYLAAYWQMTRSCGSNSAAAVRRGSRSQESKFKGVQHWKEGFTQKVETLYETPFARFQVHSVKLESGKIVDDWMWFDEAEHVNILVEKASTNGGAPAYLVLRQTKYGASGETLAIVGGLMEPGENALDTAKRELKEELGLESQEWMPLGSYRTAINRGGGIVHCYMAGNSTPIPNTRVSGEGGRAFGESEKQQLVEMSREQLVDAMLQGKFQEVKWTATIALAMLKTGIAEAHNSKLS
ncbi:expressed unknown protein [Seminavis robusta]|uniref:Nudix hydrolase domain-containing protein n=1 Tax=Seminavis robusta TaxID=568900 RepID=A0A9N8DP00_9STRA|nr:expressed unknown protein [Seminavis robusta]|eukprot:Sro185_g080270.1 n/a (264) ;mRNA; f:32102-32893